MNISKSICSIVILSYNQVEYTRKCLESIRKYTTYPHEIIVVDNASNEETIKYLEQQNDIILLKNSVNIGFAGGCNQGIEHSKGDYIMLLNNDTIVTKNWLDNMVSLLDSNDEISMVGPLTNNTVGKQKIEVVYGDDLNEMQTFAEAISESNAKPWKTLRLVAFCLLFRKKLIDEIGGFDTQFKIGNYEDDDFCIRGLSAKKEMYICRNSFVHHFMNISFTKNNLPREEIMLINKAILEEKWNNINWNHHSVINEWMIQKIIKHNGKRILHIGCGLGACSIELKDKNPDYYFVGVDDHPTRKNIAKMFVDELYNWDNKLNFFKLINGQLFDTIIIECMLEKIGPEIMDMIKPFLETNGQVILRAFNIRHITSIERIITGTVAGNLLCASSDEFQYYFSKDDVNKMLESLSYNIMEEYEVRKSLTIRQTELIEMIKDYEDYYKEGKVYNRLYLLKL